MTQPQLLHRFRAASGSSSLHRPQRRAGAQFSRPASSPVPRRPPAPLQVAPGTLALSGPQSPHPRQRSPYLPAVIMLSLFITLDIRSFMILVKGVIPQRDKVDNRTVPAHPPKYTE